MAGVRAWSIHGRIGVRGLGKSVRKLSAFNAVGKKTGSMVRGLARRIGTLAKVAGVAGVALGAIGAASVKAFATFDGAMTESLAIMGDVSEGMRERMSSAARQMAKTTTFSAKEAAESYFFLASAGLDAEQSLANLPQVANFAQAGMFDMARATELLTDAQSALGLTLEDPVENMKNMGRVSDVLVKANTLANASVEQFSEALTNRAAPALKAANKEIEEGVALLAVFADQGIKGRRAGMQVSRILRLMSTSAAENTEEFERLGLITEEGNLEDFGTIIEILTEELGGLSDAALAARLEQLGFTARVQQAIKPLLGNAEALREYQRELERAKGITKEVASKQLESLRSRFNLLGSTIVSKAIEIGEHMAPAVRDLVERLREMVDSLDVSDFADMMVSGIESAILATADFLDFLDGVIGFFRTQAGEIAGGLGLVGLMFFGPKGAAVVGTLTAIAARAGANVAKMIHGPASEEGQAAERVMELAEQRNSLIERRAALQRKIRRDPPNVEQLKDELEFVNEEFEEVSRQLNIAEKTLRRTPDAATETKTVLGDAANFARDIADNLGKANQRARNLSKSAQGFTDSESVFKAVDPLGLAKDPFGPGAQAKNMLDTMQPSLFGQLPGGSKQTSMEEQGKRLMEQGRFDEAQAVLTGKMKGVLSDSMSDAGKQAKGAATRIGRQLIQGIASGSFDAGEFLKSAFFSVVQGALFGGGGLGGGLISSLGIFSPARITMGIGANLTKGMAEGIVAEKSSVGRAMRQVGDVAVREAQGINPRLRAQVSGAGSPARAALPRRGLAELAEQNGRGAPTFDFSEFPEAKDPRQAARDREWKDFLGHSVDALREDGVL